MWDDGGSNLASRKSSRGAGHEKGLTDRLFPILALMVSPTFGTPFQGIVNSIGLAVECLQQLAFTVNPHFGFHIDVAHELMVFTYSFHLPLWDSLYAGLSYNEYVVWYWIAFVPVFLVSTYLVLGCFEFFEQGKSSTILTKVMVPMFYAVSGPFSIPILHALSANMFCDKGALWAFPDRECWELGTTIYFCVSLLGLGLTLAIMAFGACCLFNDDISTRGILDRAHGRMDMFVMLEKLVLVLLYHLLLGSGWLRSYSVFVMLLNLACFFGYAFLLPYYSITTNRVHCTIHAVSAFAALVALCSDTGMMEHDFNAALVLALMPAAALCGYYLGGVRVMHECVERMDHLSKFGEVFVHKCFFPIGLVGHDEYHHKGVTLEDEILECPMDDDVAITSQKLQNIEILVPYIQSIMVETDPEVATRFLLAHGDATRSGVGYDRSRHHLSSHMIAFAARIFLKATVRSKQPSIVEMHFANFVKTFCPPSKLTFAHEQCEIVLRSDVGFSTKFQAFRIFVTLRAQLGIHSRTHMFNLNRAKRLHKEALSDMSTFWLKLMDAKHDLMSLACLTNQITEKRHKGRLEYHKAIQDGSMDREVLVSYASFLECVMLDKRQADIVQQSISDLGEDFRKSMMGSMKSASTTSSRRLNLLTLLAGETEFERSLANSNSATLMTKSAGLSFACIVLIALGILAAGTLAREFQLQTLGKYHQCGLARSLVQIASLESFLMRDKLKVNDYEAVREHQATLQNLTRQYADAHNRLAFGSEQSGEAGIQHKFNEAGYVLYDCEGSCARPVGLLALGLELIGAFTSLSLANTEDTVELPLLAHPMNRDFNFVVENSPHAVTRAYNDTVALYKDELDAQMIWVVTGMALGLVMCIYLLITLNIVFNFNFRKIGVSKIVAIHLFSLIPSPTQKQLHLASRERIKEFDRHTREAEKGTDTLVTDALGPDADAEDEEDKDEEEGVDGTAQPGDGSGRTLGDRTLLASTSGRRMSVIDGRRGSVLGASGGFKLKGILVRKRRRGPRIKKTVRFTIPDSGRRGQTANGPKKLVEPELNFDPDSILLTDEERTELLSEDQYAMDRQRDAKQDVARKDSTVEEKKDMPNRTAYLVVGLTLLYFAALVFGLLLLFNEDAQLRDQGQHVELLREASRLQQESEQLRYHAVGYVQSGSRVDHWTPYWDTRHGRDGLDVRVRAENLLLGRELHLWWDVERANRLVAHTERIALAIAANSSSPPLPKQYTGDVRHITWVPPGDYPRDEEMQNLEYGYTTHTKDLAVDDTGALARAILSSERHQHDVTHIRTALGDVYTHSSERLQDDAFSDREVLKTYIVGHHSLFGASMLIVMLLIYFNAQGLSRLLIPFVLTSTVAFAVFQVYTDELRSVNYDEALSVAMHWNKTDVLLNDRMRTVENYYAAASPIYYVAYWDAWDRNETARMLEFMETHRDLPAWGAERLARARSGLAFIRDIHFICFELIYSLGGDATLLQQRAEHRGFQWTRTASDPEDWYMSNTVDLALPEEDRHALIRRLLFGERTHTALQYVFADIDDVFQALLDAERGRVADVKSKLNSMAVAGLLFNIVSMIFVGQIAVMAGLVTLNIGGQGVTQLVERVNKALFSSVVLKCRVAFVVVLMLMSAQFTLGVWGCTIGGSMLGNIDLSSRRDWAVARSAIAAEHLYEAYVADKVSDAHHMRLDEIVRELEETRNAFTATKQGDVTSQDHVDRLYTHWLNRLKELSSSTRAGFVSDRTPSIVHEELRGQMDDLIAKVRESSKMSMNEMSSKVDDVWLFLLLMSISVVLIVAGELEFVFRPIMRQLVNEENGTMVLLKMIPAKVREIVPKITAYLETGIIIDEKEDEARYPPDPTVTVFMKKFGQADPGDTSPMQVLEQSSSGIIVSDTLGVVIGCNEAVLALVGYERSELMGKNVAKLVPDPLSHVHQKFIDTYIATGNARIIGKGRDALVVDAHDRHLHCYLQLSELRQRTDLYFVAQINKYSLLEEKIAKRKAELAKA